MLGRTHELGALSAAIVTSSIVKPNITGEVAAISIIFALFGGLSPDLDTPTSLIYKKIPAGSIFGKIIHPIFIGGHRHLSHSIIGIFLFGLLLKYLLFRFSSFSTYSQEVFLISYLIGYTSHIFLDGLTKEGVPLLFPLPIVFAFPPIKKLRIKTGGLIEHLIVVPLILLVIAYFIFSSPKIF